VGGFDRPAFQGVAQRVRHGFRIAEIAHPFANGEGRREIDTFTIPKGRRRRVYRPCGQI
jgi:hypothetical protein